MRESDNKKSEDVIPNERLIDIASSTLRVLVDADPIEAEIYFNEVLELTNEERTALGLDSMQLF